MLLHKKLFYNRWCVGSGLVLIVLFYVIIYDNLPDISSRVIRGREDNGQTKEDISQIREDAKFKGTLTQENIGKVLTIVIREFEDFDNALSKTVGSIQAALGSVPIFIVADHLPYPPVVLDLNDGVRMITLSSDLTRNYTSVCPMHLFTTQYVFIVPDSVKIRDWKQVQNIVTLLQSQKNTKAIAVPVGSAELECEGLNVDLKRWSVSFYGNYSEKYDCPMLKGSHALLMEATTFKSLAEPFARPFPFTFYVQAKLKDWKVKVTNSERLGVLSELYREPHSSWKHKKLEVDRLRLFYEAVGVKQEILAKGGSRFYGCSKDTARCFGTVVNDMPDFLYLGRWTPPCCLKALRETARHVISVLELCKVRYWLEGGSLLGAARHHDIIPWDYDVDLGIYKEDIEICPPLTKARERKYVDLGQFVWEKATEGDFYRVQYSDINHLHVDIFPFYSSNGVMTKDTWFPTHKQDKEFPERFLQPLTKIEFAGIVASAPNNIKEFLEYKFGEGVIDKPKYPNLQKPVM